MSLVSDVQNLSIIKNIEKQQFEKPVAVIEITVTNECNGNCKYCFESDHSLSKINKEEQRRQLALIEDFCKTLDFNKFNGVQIVFWGGEPTLNFDFVIEIIEKTIQYPFVNYLIYSNGTQFTQFFRLNFLKFKDALKQKLEIQLSYDGEPHNTIKRGDTREQILKTAQMLIENGFIVRFKATLSYDMIKYLPEIWKSYYELYLMFGDCVSYSPTLDTMIFDQPENIFEDWKKSLLEVASLEYIFIKKFHRSLMSWYSSSMEKKLACNIDYHINIHLDGNIYPCHGCSYSSKFQNYIIGQTDSITDLNQVLNKQIQTYERTVSCKECGATFCNICHVSQCKSECFRDDWIKSMNTNTLRCKFFKYFGFIKNALDLALLNGRIQNIYTEE